MKVKVLLVVGGVVGAVGALAALKPRVEGDAKGAMAQRMREHLESMPEEFPPRMMFDNLAATRANTEEILRILQDEDQPNAATTDS